MTPKRPHPAGRPEPDDAMRDLLQLPALWSVGRAPPELGAGPPLAERLRAAVDRLLASAAEDPAAALAAALGARADGPQRAFAARAAARLGAEAACPDALYACAAEAVAGGELAAASVGLAALLEDPATLPAALLGLAICALHADRPDEALAMALSSRQGEAGHPRAYAVAGVAEHLRGHASQARLYLALSARLARTAAEHAPDLRLAQRLLLAMQVG